MCVPCPTFFSRHNHSCLCQYLWNTTRSRFRLIIPPPRQPPWSACWFFFLTPSMHLSHSANLFCSLILEHLSYRIFNVGILCISFPLVTSPVQMIYPFTCFKCVFFSNVTFSELSYITILSKISVSRYLS